MPAGTQKVDGQLPGPPAFTSAVMSANIFWYSGVSGGGPASGIQLFGLPTRTHCPFRFGYLPKSTIWAAAGAAESATANRVAQIEPGYFMDFLPAARSPNASPPISTAAKAGGKIHRPLIAVDNIWLLAFFGILPTNLPMCAI